MELILCPSIKPHSTLCHIALKVFGGTHMHTIYGFAFLGTKKRSRWCLHEKEYEHTVGLFPLMTTLILRRPHLFNHPLLPVGTIAHPCVKREGERERDHRGQVAKWPKSFNAISSCRCLPQKRIWWCWTHLHGPWRSTIAKFWGIGWCSRYLQRSCVVANGSFITTRQIWSS